MRRCGSGHSLEGIATLKECGKTERRDASVAYEKLSKPSSDVISEEFKIFLGNLFFGHKGF